MGKIVSEGLSYIGSIDDSGYIYNTAGRRIGKIMASGDIVGESGRGLGKISPDGTITNTTYDAVGRIQADGYVYLYSRRVCKVSSDFIERITPQAWNAGQPSTYSGRASDAAVENNDSAGTSSFFTSSFFIKLVIGLVLGVAAMVMGAGGIEMLIAGPIVVFLISFIAKLFG